jgi:hypothetical protein
MIESSKILKSFKILLNLSNEGGEEGHVACVELEEMRAEFW